MIDSDVETRLIIAYALIALLMVAGITLVVWLRRNQHERRHRMSGRRRR